MSLFSWRVLKMIMILHGIGKKKKKKLHNLALLIRLIYLFPNEDLWGGRRWRGRLTVMWEIDGDTWEVKTNRLKERKNIWVGDHCFKPTWLFYFRHCSLRLFRTSYLGRIYIQVWPKEYSLTGGVRWPPYVKCFCRWVGVGLWPNLPWCKAISAVNGPALRESSKIPTGIPLYRWWGVILSKCSRVSFGEIMFQTCKTQFQQDTAACKKIYIYNIQA